MGDNTELIHETDHSRLSEQHFNFNLLEKDKDELLDIETSTTMDSLADIDYLNCLDGKTVTVDSDDSEEVEKKDKNNPLIQYSQPNSILPSQHISQEILDTSNLDTNTYLNNKIINNITDEKKIQQQYLSTSLTASLQVSNNNPTLNIQSNINTIQSKNETMPYKKENAEFHRKIAIAPVNLGNNLEKFYYKKNPTPSNTYIFSSNKRKSDDELNKLNAYIQQKKQKSCDPRLSSSSTTLSPLPTVPRFEGLFVFGCACVSVS